MTLDSVFSQWASSITVSSATPPVVAINQNRNAAKSPQMRGYLECSVANTAAADVDGANAVEYPFEVVFHSADGSTYTLDMKADDTRATTGYAGSGDPGQSTYTNEAVSGRFVPVNNALLRLMISSDWVVGAADSYSASSGNNAIW